QRGFGVPGGVPDSGTPISPPPQLRRPARRGPPGASRGVNGAGGNFGGKTEGIWGVEPLPHPFPSLQLPPSLSGVPGGSWGARPPPEAEPLAEALLQLAAPPLDFGALLGGGDSPFPALDAINASELPPPPPDFGGPPMLMSYPEAIARLVQSQPPGAPPEMGLGAELGGGPELGALGGLGGPEESLPSLGELDFSTFLSQFPSS
uniref:Uncharacterized protein n=1 Tax=Taeniopygia guttata TaxID=59729 RepID=A0A674H6B7_TAEGU